MSTDRRWEILEAESPDLAKAGIRLLYQDAEIATALLATVAPDGGPRVHPVCPMVTLGDLWLFIVNMSPKYRDLKRNGSFALHSVLTPEGGEEFHLRGSATEVTDPDTRHVVVEATGNRQGHADFEALFRCDLSSALYTKWDGWGTDNAWPGYLKWFASPQGSTTFR